MLPQPAASQELVINQDQLSTMPGSFGQRLALLKIGLGLLTLSTKRARLGQLDTLQELVVN